MHKDLELIQNLVGAITPDQLRHIEGAVTEDIGLFVPVTGACGYATTPSHCHPAYSFVLTFDNHSQIKLDNGETRSIPAGRICSFSPGVPHQEIESERPPRYIAIMISAPFFELMLDEYHLPPKRLNGCHHPLPDNLVGTTREFILEYGNDQPGKASMLSAIGIRLTHQLIRAIFCLESPISTLAARLQIRRAQEFIHHSFGQKITIEDIALKAGLSAAHFSREFKKETGQTPMDYLRHVRLGHARTLLIDGERNLTEIAMDCGFNSSSHFSSCFRQRYHLSPSAFRNVFSSAES
ncbi:MAG: AraC family transcriptional regulator [Pontiellaceae bacterium]|nr:AraC family transcriptional regulator [Pontiellaceae bacterium]